ncbi:hypothetical protein KCU65_g8517, partial [Aureobasidium melanogenum]
MSVRSDVGQSAGATAESPDKRPRRRRLLLSCGECSSHATVTGLVNAARGQAVRISAPMTRLQSDSKEVRRLRREIASLRSLTSQRQLDSNHANAEASTQAKLDSTPTIPSRTASDTADFQSDTSRNAASFQHPKDRSPQGYYSKHSLFKFFTEITQFVPFTTEVTEEWLLPAGVKLKKQKTIIPRDENLTLDALLPPQADADQLVAFYLDNYEHLHRIVHVPTFKKQYHDFWLSDQSRSPAIASLIMSIMAVSASAPPIGERYKDVASHWSLSVDEWLRHHSPKRYELIHYQVLLLSYLAKRMNQIHKKMFWTESSNLLQRAILDELPSTDSVRRSDNVFHVEMRRRIWHVIRELELQNSYEFGLPTLLHNIDCNLGAPANIADEEFDEYCSTSVVMSCSSSNIELMERSLAIAAERSLRCSKAEPWCFISISAAISLIKVHLGILDRPTAKYSCAQAFLDLHKQQPTSQTLQQSFLQSASHDIGRDLHTSIDASTQQLTDIPPYIAWLDGDIFDFGFEAHTLDMNVNGMWQEMETNS